MQPINTVIGIFIVYLVWKLVQPVPRVRPDPTMEPRPAPRPWTLAELRQFDGTGGRPVYMAIKGRVFDVTRGRAFYGPGGPYALFAGRDASRGLARMTTDVDQAFPHGRDSDQARLRAWCP